LREGPVTGALIQRGERPKTGGRRRAPGGSTVTGGPTGPTRLPPLIREVVASAEKED